MLELVRKDIEGVFGHLKIRFLFLKHFDRMHHQNDIDNDAFVTCMLLQENGCVGPHLEEHPEGLTNVLRQHFANVALDGL